jgi:hypothetical protein
MNQETQSGEAGGEFAAAHGLDVLTMLNKKITDHERAINVCLKHPTAPLSEIYRLQYEIVRLKQRRAILESV